jgi:hypothetical protein
VRHSRYALATRHCIGSAAWRKHTKLTRQPAGTGAQFLVIMLALIVMALAGTFNTHQHGYANTAGVVLYAFTSGALGYGFKMRVVQFHASCFGALEGPGKL